MRGSEGNGAGHIWCCVIHTAAWRRLRVFVLRRDPYCVGYPLGTHGAVRVCTTSVDHVRPRSLGGTHALDNLRGLCGSCNSRKAMSEEGARTWRSE